MLMVKEQHAALDPNRLGEKVLESLCRLENHWKNRVQEGKGMKNGSYMITHLQQLPLLSSSISTGRIF